MKGAAVITFSVLLHLCGPLWLGASGVVRNRTEDLPIVFPDDDNVASAGDATPLTTRTARRLPDPPFVRSKGVSESAWRIVDPGACCVKKKAPSLVVVPEVSEDTRVCSEIGDWQVCATF